MPAIDDGVLVGIMLKEIDKSLPEEKKKLPTLDVILIIISLIGWVAMAVIFLLTIINTTAITDAGMWLVGLFASEIITYFILVMRYLERVEKILDEKKQSAP